MISTFSQGRSDDGQSIAATQDQAAQLIRLLEFEIGRIRAEIQRPGWTRWALLGSLAAILWLALAEFEAHTILMQNVLFVFLLLSTLSSNISFLRELLLQRVSNRSRSLRFEFSTTLLGPTRPSVLVAFGKAVTLLAIAATLPSQPGRLCMISIYVFYGIMLFLFVAGLLASYINLPIPRYSLNFPAGHRILFLILFLTSAIGVYGLATLIYSKVVWPTVFDWRVGGLAMTASVLLLWLAKGDPEIPLLQSLINIRRSLGLGEVSIESAKQQADIALSGMRISDVLQGQVVEIVSKINEAASRIDHATLELTGAKKLIKEKGTALLPEERAIISATMQSSDEHITGATTTVAELKAKSQLFVTRFKWLKRFQLPDSAQPQASEGMSPLIEKIMSALTHLDEKNQTAHGVVEELQSLLQKITTIKITATQRQKKRLPPKT